MADSEEREAKLNEILTKENDDILASEEDKNFLLENKGHLDDFTKNERFKDTIDFTKEPAAKEEDGGDLVLEDVLKKEAGTLSDDEQKFLEENKTSLNSDQQKKYGIVTEEEEVEVKVRGGKEKEEEEEDTDKKKKPKEEEEEEEEEIDPEVDKVLDKKIAKATAPIQELEKLLQTQRDEAEVIKFVREHPEAGKYERALNAYRAHPKYEGVPIENIYYIVAGEDLKRQGAEEALKAKEEADRSGLGGGGRRPTDKGDKSKLPDIGKTEVGSKESKELLQRAMSGDLKGEEAEE